MSCGVMWAVKGIWYLSKCNGKSLEHFKPVKAMMWLMVLKAYFDLEKRGECRGKNSSQETW